MIILTDCDGVLLNWLFSFTKWIEEFGYVCARKEAYDLAKKYDCDPDEIAKLTAFFNRSAEIEWLQPLRDARKYIRLMYDQGAMFHCITAVGNHSHTHRLRKKNLQRVFGKTTFTTINCVKRASDKKKVLKTYQGRNDVIWIEDSISNANAGDKIGFQTFLMNQEYNQADPELRPNVTRVNNWKEIYETLY